MGSGVSSNQEQCCTRSAQISMEYILIVGFGLALVIPLLLIFHNQINDINDELSDAQVGKAADELITAIDSVYYLGAPSTKTLKLYFPAYIKQVTFYNHSFTILVESPDGDWEAVRYTSATLDGDIRTPGGGLSVITIKANEHNVTIRN